MEELKGVLKTADTDYKTYGLTRNKSESWEDGQRLDPLNYKAGEYEWWYTDGRLSNGVFFVASFHIEVMDFYGEKK